jgi:hypothetical protein
MANVVIGSTEESFFRYLTPLFTAFAALVHGIRVGARTP